MSYSQLTLTYSAGNPDSLFQYLKPILYFIDVAHVIECMFMLMAVIMLISYNEVVPRHGSILQLWRQGGRQNN